MHILMAIESFFPYSQGGTEKSVLQLAHFLINKGHKVSILTPDDNGKKNESAFENISIFYFSSPLVFSKEETYGLKSASNLVAFQNQLKTLSPDIFHLHSFSPALNSFHLEAVKKLGIKTIFTPRLANNFCINNGQLVKANSKACDAKVGTYTCLRCSLKKNLIGGRIKRYIMPFLTEIAKNNHTLSAKISPYYLRAYAKKKELKRAAQNTDAVIAISDWVKKAFTVNGFNNVVQIDQGIDFEKQYNQLFSYKPTIFTYIGRFSPEKGIEILLNTLSQLKDYPFRLNIVTFDNNVDKDYFDTIIRNSGLKERISFHFNQSTSQVYQILTHSHWLCLLSKIRDTAPRVIHEAFACQVPCIVSQHIPDFVIHNINGIRININNKKALLSTFKEILSDEAYWQKLKKNITPPRNMDMVGEEHLAIYKKLV